MNILEDPELKKTYDKCKYKVKVWEHQFTKKYKRIPSKLDIREAPTEIRHAYRRYFKIKTASLEESFVGIEGFDDDDDGGGLEQLQLSNENFTEEVVEDVWGDHLNKPKQLTTLETVPDKGPSKPVLNISKKLFCASKTTQKRNPRKSLSKKSFDTFKSEEAIQVLLEESPPQVNTPESVKSIITPSLPISIFDRGEKPLNKVDPDWLRRTKVDYDSDEIIENSDDEDSTMSSRSFSGLHIAKRMRWDEPRKEQPKQMVEAVAQQPIIEASKSVIKQKQRLSKKALNKTTSKDITIRRSGRNNKLKASLEELSSGEEDPFASDNDSSDPEFTLEKENHRFGRDLKLLSPATEPNKTESQKKKKSKKPVTTEVVTESYELEYNVKPRKTAPRFASILNVVKSKKTEEKPKKKPSKSKAEEKLEQRVNSGTLNDNFVTINLRKKIFTRGKKTQSFTKMKKSEWKKKKKSLYGPDMDMGGCDGGKLICFNCNQEGHFAQRCPNKKSDNLLRLNEIQEEDECPIMSLEEAQQMAMESNLMIRKSNKVIQSKDNQSSSSEWEDDDVDESQLLAEVARLEEHVKRLDVEQYMDNTKVVEPYYSTTNIEPPQEVFDALHKFGHKSFKPGQLDAVLRILEGKSTLVTLSTGSGKSLCYQLPAYLYSQREPCISLVISPLVSLMEDQVHGIPKFLKAACLHTNQTPTQRQKVLDAISSGDLHVLLVSPETIVAGEKSTGFGGLLRKLPPIAFACIDEAHCVSQWSHNFRPSYLLICRVLRESLGVKTILGLTATATRTTCESIVDSLGIADQGGVITDVPLPDNLQLTVSRDANRDRALLNLLLSDRFKGCNSVIVYCTRREECERVAGFLRTSLKSDFPVNPEVTKKRKRLNLQAEPYHAGMSASKRKSVQNAFMAGDLRVVVATVAFGMGINKSDIRAVIHYNMPNSFESYVQEVGRAGRDGLPAFCHVFLDSQGKDENELRRHIHANSVERHTIRKLLKKIFVSCACTDLCPKHEVAFSVEDTVRSLDLPEENIATLLCYLELHKNKYIELLNPAYTNCKVISYNGPLQLRRAAKDCAPLAMGLALHPPVDQLPNVLEFPVVEVASVMGWDSGICKHKLKNLEWIVVNGQSKRSSLSVQFTNLGFRLLAPGNLSDEQLDEALESLHSRVIDQETKALRQLRSVHELLSKCAQTNYKTCPTDNSELKQRIREYFTSIDPLNHIKLKSNELHNEEQIINDIKTLVIMYRDTQFTGRAVARIFHGIQSPNYPAVIWGRCKYWRSHLKEDFHEISRVATREIIKMR